MAKALKEAKLEELSQTEPLIENAKELWDGILSRTRVTITGENYDVSENLQTIASVLTFEQDPVRRAFLLDTIYAAKGIPVPPAVQQGLQAEKSEGPATKQQIESIAKAGLPSEGALV
jgi:hypothetical protein